MHVHRTLRRLLVCVALVACLTVVFACGALSAAQYTAEMADQDWVNRSQPGMADEMVARLEAATRETPSDGELFWRLSRAYWWKAARYTTDRNAKLQILDKAKAAAEEGVRLAPGNADAHYWHAVSIAQAGQIRGVLQSLFMVRPCKEALDKALAIDPTHASAHYLMAELLHQVPGPPISIGNKTKAVEEARLAVKYDPEETSHHLVLAKCLVQTRQYQEARQALEHVLSMSGNPNDPEGTRLDKEEAAELLASIKGK
jgi:cytochrome c-type biogenesis protein CcmH/NrfG